MKLRSAALALLLPATLVLPVLAATEASATVTYGVRGTVTCPGGYPVSGVYLHSSGGGSAFASWTAYPGASNIARFSKSFTTNLSTTLYFSVGCGRGNSPGSWKTSNVTPKVTVSSGSIYYTNAECNARGACSYFPMENNTPAATSYNPVRDTTQCTYRAADFWKLMTKRYPNWRDNAGWWDDNAAATGWSVRAWPRINSLFVKQPTSTSPYGHVGYVADVRVSSGVLQMKIYDRNADGRDIGTNRNGVWITWTSSMRFIVPPGRSGEVR